MYQMFVRITPTFATPHLILHEYKQVATHLKSTKKMSNKKMSRIKESQYEDDISEYVLV